MAYARFFQGLTATPAGWRRLAAGFFCAAFLLASPLAAQEEEKDEPVKLTAQERAALLGAATGTKAGLKELNDLLTKGDPSADEIKARAKTLLEQLKDGGFIEDAGAVMAAADRIIQAAVSNIGGGARIVQFEPDADFIPPKNVIALDFGPADKPVSKGFERVTNNDLRVSGANQDGLQSIRRPGDDGLQSGGLIGVSKLKVPLTQTGRWRIILMTEAIGEGGSVSAPFGSVIIVNGVAIPISEALPKDWAKIARLKKDGAESVAQVANSGTGVSARFVGGMIILEVDVPGGHLEIEFDDGTQGTGPQKTYLTGAIFEPANQPSILDLPPEAKKAVFSSEKRLLAEADIGSTMAKLIAKLVPEAGEKKKEVVKLLDLPKPILKDEQLASPS